MTVQDFERLFDYGYWANATLFPVIAQLTPEQFTQFIDTRHGSIRNTIVHMLIPPLREPAVGRAPAWKR